MSDCVDTCARVTASFPELRTEHPHCFVFNHIPLRDIGEMEQKHAITGPPSKILPLLELSIQLDYALWLVPEDGLKLLLLIRDLASSQPLSPPFAPHITMLHPIPIATPLLEIQRRVKAVTRETLTNENNNLILDILPAQHGDHYYQSVLAPIRAQSTLTALRDGFEKAFGIDNAPVYFPHLSLLYGELSQEAKQGIADRVNADPNSLPHSIRVSHVDIVKCQGTVEEWATVGSISL